MTYGYQNRESQNNTTRALFLPQIRILLSAFLQLPESSMASAKLTWGHQSCGPACANLPGLGRCPLSGNLCEQFFPSLKNFPSFPFLPALPKTQLGDELSIKLISWKMPDSEGICPGYVLGCTQAILKVGFIVGWCIWFVRQGVDITCLLCLEPKLKRNCQMPSLMGTRNNPKQCRKGLEATSVPGRREAPSSSELLWCWNNLSTAEEVGSNTDQVAGVQIGTGEMLRASLLQIPAFLSRENNQEFGFLLGPYPTNPTFPDKQMTPQIVPLFPIGLFAVGGTTQHERIRPSTPLLCRSLQTSTAKCEHKKKKIPTNCKGFSSLLLEKPWTRTAVERSRVLLI